MKVVIATMTLRAIGNGKTFVLDLQGAAANRAGETGAAAL
jgi:nitrogen regulatory protein PII